MIGPDAHRLARGRRVTVDAAVLLEFVDASKKLYRLLLDNTPATAEIDRKLERWEIAQSTLVGSVQG